jgi:hypothetical protein
MYARYPGCLVTFLGEGRTAENKNQCRILGLLTVSDCDALMIYSHRIGKVIEREHGIAKTSFYQLIQFLNTSLTGASCLFARVSDIIVEYEQTMLEHLLFTACIST